MACKYIFNNTTYSSKEEFIKEVLEKDFLNQPKTLRIQEIQQPDFLKNIRKDKDYLKSLGLSKKQQSFLNLLFGDNEKWVKFFVSSLIQNAAKNGYSKVWLPSGNTSAKVEGHTTLEEFKKQKEDRIKELERKLENKQDELAISKNLLDSDKRILQREIEKIPTEINQLKQELERLEGPEGFGALKPIWNFYENVVTNILKKNYNINQITDEYGNTWNEISITPEIKNQVILLQKKSSKQITSSPELINKIKQLAKKWGIDITSLQQYVKQHPDIDITDVNGLADLMQKTIAIAEGKENEALTEEVVHIATAILNVTQPEIITKLISRIDKFKIYNTTLEKYSKDRNYQLSDGKPDIRKIKKEAVDKLIVELIVNKSEGNEYFPELEDKEKRNIIQQWWDLIIDAIRSLYRGSEINLFEKTADVIMSGELGGDVNVIQDKGVYFQIDPGVKQKIDDYVDKIMENNDKLVLHNQILDENGKEIQKRHYTFDGKKVKFSVTEFLKNKFKDSLKRTDFQKKQDEEKRDWGSEGHLFIENYINKNLIDEKGYRKKEFTNESFDSKLPEKLQELLKEFSINLINTYPENTRFIIEKKVINTKVQGMMASTVDFKAVYPITKPNGEQDFKIDTLDWKFTAFDKTTATDIHHKKRKEWVAQMGQYNQIDYNYGVKRENLGKSRMIPFITNYEYKIKGEKNSGLIPTSFEIGKLDVLEETNLYLLPTLSEAETTGNDAVDKLVKALKAHFEKVYSKSVEGEDKVLKTQQLETLNAAIRNLQLKLNFKPLFDVGKAFFKNAKKSIDKYEKIDFNTINAEQVKSILKDLIEYKNSAEKFLNLDKIFLESYPKNSLNGEQLKLLKELEDVSTSADRMNDVITDLLKVYVANLAVKEKIVTNIEDTLKAEIEEGGLAKNMLEGSKLSPKILQLFQQMVNVSSSEVAMNVSKRIKEWVGLTSELERVARSRSKKAFDLIGKVRNGNLEYIQKLDKKYFEELSVAKEQKNKKFILNNINVEEYNTLVKEYIEKGIQKIEYSFYNSDPETNEKLKEFAKNSFKNSIDINSSSFNGWHDYNFNQFIKQTLKEEQNYSEEYIQMSKIPEALAVWNKAMEYNEKGINMGYLKGKPSSFFAMVEATTLQKLGKTSNLFQEGKDIFKGLYSTRINAQQGLSKVDPETGKVIEKVPKYFTQTDKALHQLSTDLSKVGALWIKSLYEYENAINLEDTIQAMLVVEKSKGSLVTENGKVLFEGTEAMTKQENKNYDILKVMANDFLYDLREDSASMGNTVISTIAKKTSKTKEGEADTAMNIKTTLNNANALLRGLAVGLKPLIAISSWTGNHLHAVINAGSHYKGIEHKQSYAKVLLHRLNIVEKGVLDLLVALNEDVMDDNFKSQLFKKGQYSKWLANWTFTDVMMSSNSVPEKGLQLANALAMIKNSMIVEGKIINIRQYLKKQDSKTKYKLSEQERKTLEKSFDQRVKELQNSPNALLNLAKIENDEIVIPGVDNKELAKFRVAILNYGRKLNGQMSAEDKAEYSRDTLFKSFMMFKTWMPKLVSERALDIHKNIQLDQWEYGRVRVFFKTWSHLGFTKIYKIRQIITGSEEGLKIMDEMLQAKRQDFFAKTGHELEITNEEFYDLIRKELSNEMKELGVMFSAVGLILAAGAAEPPEDASDLEKNRYKLWAKMVNKMTDEILFYYNPLAFEGMTKGSVLPALNLLTRGQRVIEHVVREFGDEPDKAYPGKAFFSMIPIASQFQTEILPYLDPELAKAWGIRVTSLTRGSGAR